MNKQYSFSNDQMNGIVEETYANIIKECENLKKIVINIKNTLKNKVPNQLTYYKVSNSFFDRDERI